MQAGVGRYGVFSGKRWESQSLSDCEERDFVEQLRA
jgi:poly-beta-hydroxyalkanoate depolymerase